MKINGAIQDKNVCKMLHSLHTNAPILKEVEEQAEQILDADYSNVNINKIVDGLDINKDLEGNLKETLNKFPTLFDGGLGKLSEDFPEATIKLKKGAKPYAATYYNLSKAKLKYSSNDPKHKLVMWMNNLEFTPGCDDKRLYDLTEETEIAEET